MTKILVLMSAAALAAAVYGQAPDGRGVAVDLGGAPLMHRTPLNYPREALDSGVEGTVVAQLKLNGSGEVVDANIVSGPDELRRSVLQGVLGWHFSKQIAGSTRQVTVTFHAPPKQDNDGRVVAAALPAASAQAPRTVGGIAITGLSDEARTQLESQLPVHTGETLTPELRARVMEAVKSFDSHLSASVVNEGPNEVSVRIAPGGALFAATGAPARIRVGGNVQQSKLISQPHPVYPPDAKAARVQGTVSMQATIGADGKIEALQVISGPPQLVQSALDAVKQWVYAPTLLNGNPVEVVTQIDVNYTLTQ